MKYDYTVIHTYLRGIWLWYEYVIYCIYWYVPKRNIGVLICFDHKKIWGSKHWKHWIEYGRVLPIFSRLVNWHICYSRCCPNWGIDSQDVVFCEIRRWYIILYRRFDLFGSLMVGSYTDLWGVLLSISSIYWLYKLYII